MKPGANIEDIYRLTELQEALLVHRLQRGERDTGTLAVRGSLIGPLDAEAFSEAWLRTLARHPVGRSSVHWEELKHPVQVVARSVDVELEGVDLTSLPIERRDRRLAELERQACEGPLDVTRAPVMRWTLVRLGEREHRLIWVCHHLLLDGWSSALLLDEVLRRHDSIVHGDPFEPSPAPRFRDWLTWLRERDDVDPATFWAERDLRLAEPWARPDWTSGAGGERLERIEAATSIASSAIDDWARLHRTRPAALLLGCWALTLAEAVGSTETSFGFTASGRGADFPGIESLVGMLANTVPLSVEVQPSVPIDGWIREVARRQLDVQRFERCSLGRLLRAGGFFPRRPPFDTVVAYASYPGVGDPAEGRAADRLRLGTFDSDVTSGHPLTLAIVPSRQLRLRAHVLPGALDRAEVETALARFEAIALAVLGGEATRVGELVSIDPSRRRPPTPAPSPAPRELDDDEREEPGTPAASQLLRIWLALLDRPAIGLDQSFFDLGGNSVLLPKMIDRVYQDFGVELPLGVVFQSPTVRALARVIDSGGPDRSWRCLVPIRERGPRPPLFLVHSLEGELGRYYDLANRLPARQPVFGLQAPAEELTAIPDMAARYLTEIRRHQPRGPYHVGGFCVGGIVAFEMARQLSAAGESVGLLALLDCLAPGPLFALSTTVPPSARELARMAVEEPGVLLGRVAHRAVRTVRRRARTRRDGDAPVELDEVRDLRAVPPVYREASMRHFRAARDYAPDPWPGDAWLLRTVDDRFPSDLGWGKLVGGRLDVAVVPGHHTGAFEEPHVEELGRRLAALIGPSARSRD